MRFVGTTGNIEVGAYNKKCIGLNRSASSRIIQRRHFEKSHLLDQEAKVPIILSIGVVKPLQNFANFFIAEQQWAKWHQTLISLKNQQPALFKPANGERHHRSGNGGLDSSC